MLDNKLIQSFLHNLPLFANVEATAIEWLLEKGRVTFHQAGSSFFQPGEEINELHIIIEGLIDVYIEEADGRRPLFLLERGTVTGNLPFSRMQSATATGKILEDTTVFRLHKDYFVEMVNESYKLTQAFVSVMSDRIRSVSSNRFQDEKLKALGKISAGLAHELNNPASAMVRSAAILHEKLSTTPEHFKGVMRLDVSEEQTDAVNAILFEKIESHIDKPKDLNLLERQDLVDDLTDWMEDHSVEDADELAETFTDFCFQEADFERILAVLKTEEKLGPTLRWFDNRLSVELLVAEIQEASSRIANLVQSIKRYSHMDEGNAKKPTDIHDGIRTTLNILGHRFKQKQIGVDKHFMDNPPKIMANPGELNQVWTNLLSNAIDALPDGGKVKVSTYLEGDYLSVKVEDNGTGIPEDIKNRIWEPFFTTKAVGEGTGIGLDVVKGVIQKHRGSIDVTSEPGETVFTICFLKE